MALLEVGERFLPEVVVRRSAKGEFFRGGRWAAIILCKEETVVVGGSAKVRDGMPEKDFTRALIILNGESGDVIVVEFVVSILYSCS